MKDELRTKKVRCFHRGCKGVVEVSLYADEMQYCTKHTKGLSEAYERMWRRLNER